MVQIEINGQILDLGEKSKIDVKLRNEMLFESILPKYYSYPFNIPLNAHNSKILNMPQEWQHKITYKGVINCIVYLFGDGKPRNAQLTVRSITEHFAELYFIVDKDAEETANKKLNEIDMGTMTITNSNIFASITLALRKQSISNIGVYNVKLNINNIPFNFAITSMFTFADFMPRCNVAFPILVNNINASSAGVSASYNFNTFTDEAELTLTSTIANKPIKITDWRLYPGPNPYVPADGYWYWWILNEDNYINSFITNIYNGIKNINADYVNNGTQYPCLFPIVNNTQFVGDNPTNFVLFQNYKLLETVADKNKLAFVTPMPFLTYVLKIVFETLGFNAEGEFFNHPAIKKLILYSNVANDDWFYLYGAPNIYNSGGLIYLEYGLEKNINIHSNFIDINKITPDLTIREFLIAVKTAFNLKYIYNYKDKTVNVDFISDIQGSKMQYAKDYTASFVNAWSILMDSTKAVNIKSFEFETDSNDKQNEFLLPYQEKLIIDENGNKEIKNKLGTIGEEIIEGCIMPSVKIEGVYNGGGSPSSNLKLLQVFGFRNDRNNTLDRVNDQLFALSQDSYPVLSYISSLSISWKGDKGFYSKYWKEFTKLLIENRVLKIQSTFNNEQIQDLENNPFIFVRGALLLYKEMDLTLDEQETNLQEGMYVIV